MNKADLIEALEQKLGSRQAANDAVNVVVDTIVRAVSKGERVAISGFGTFEKVQRAARTGRNPRTGETVRIKRTSVPRFKPGGAFKGFVAAPRSLPKNSNGNVPVTARVSAGAAEKPAAKKKATAKKATAKKAAGTKAAPKKAAAKKAAPKRATAKKAAAKKAPAKKAPVRKTVAKKAPAKKAPARKTVAKKAPAKKAPARKTVAKKAPAKRAPAKKRATASRRGR